ncbi:MAG: hypothetical protein H6895_12290 [Defluviimonas sp.]|uniref:DUF6693 family protein n=1 Tax=Albidovulum sp. TaxID=1872424 RepID=UPI001E02F63F|nr:hypothetical protein [Paracoccaceae bacterium]MCC0064849.1 hypothetical protein [Defluviimonas sp.]
MTYRGLKLKCDFSVGEAVGQFIIWLLLTIVTLGLALFVLPYYFVRAPINRTTLVDASGRTVARLHVDVGFSDIVGHALVWLLLTIVTLGLAYLIYWPAVIKRVLNAVVIADL